MICPGCQKEIKDGVFICPDCGYEIRFVPDFDIETEDIFHIPQVTSMLPKLDEDMLQKTKVALTETKIILKPQDEEEKPNWKRAIVFIIPSVVVLILIVAILIAVFHKSETWLDVYKRAEEAYLNEDYDTAIAMTYEALGFEDCDSEDLKLFLAGVTYKSGSISETERIYLKLIEDDAVNKKQAYENLIYLYQNCKEYEKLAEFIEDCPYDDLKNRYSDYMVEVPSFSLEEGVYDDVQYLKLKADGKGKILYASSGKDPLVYGRVYTEPILLQRGDYEITAVYVNEYDVSGMSVSHTYFINTLRPREPIVLLDSGYYTNAQLIYVNKNDMNPIYYTIDGGEPTTASTLYEGPVPLLLGEHVYKFASINVYGDLCENIIERSYNFTPENAIAVNDAVGLIYDDQTKFADRNGMLADGSGRMIYSCNSAIPLNGSDYYLFEEYKITTEYQTKTDQYIGVNLYNGEVIQLTRDINGIFSKRNE